MGRIVQAENTDTTIYFVNEEGPVNFLDIPNFHRYRFKYDGDDKAVIGTLAAGQSVPTFMEEVKKKYPNARFFSSRDLFNEVKKEIREKYIASL